MAKFGKWIGGGLGWAFGGPIGALLGFALGSVFDKTVDGSVEFNQTTGGRRTNTSKPGDFGASLLVLVAAVMKADGKVLKVELDYVKKFFIKQFGSKRTQEHLLILKEILKKDIPLKEVCIQIRAYTLYPARLQLLHLLFGVASVDGEIAASEIRIINQIASYLGIKQVDFTSIRAMFLKEVDGDYKILEIAKTASNDDVKKAYRKMAIKYHPDKVIHMGEEYKQSAKEKFQKVQDAYDNVKKQRGMK
jgi:DnaJ like chaperone protein